MRRRREGRMTGHVCSLHLQDESSESIEESCGYTTGKPLMSGYATLPSVVKEPPLALERS
jgi:hypothetical protein